MSALRASKFNFRVWRSSSWDCKECMLSSISMTSWSVGRGSLRMPSEDAGRRERDKDIHGWWVNRIFRLFEGVNNDYGHSMGDGVLPCCEVIERRDTAKHFETRGMMKITRKVAGKSKVVLGKWYLLEGGNRVRARSMSGRGLRMSPRLSRCRVSKHRSISHPRSGLAASLLTTSLLQTAHSSLPEQSRG